MVIQNMLNSYFYKVTRLGGGLVTKSCTTLETPWTVACQAPLYMGFSRQEYWSGLQFPSAGDLPNPVIKPGSPALQADSFLIEKILLELVFICLNLVAVTPADACS